MSDRTYPIKLAEVLNKYYQDEEAKLSAIALVCALRSVRKVLAQESDDDVRFGVLTFLTDFCMALPKNAFWQRNAVAILPVFNNAVVGFLDSIRLMDMDSKLPANADKTELRIRILALQNLIYEVPIAIYYAHVNHVEAREKSMMLRQDIMAIRQGG